VADQKTIGRNPLKRDLPSKKRITAMARVAIPPQNAILPERSSTECQEKNAKQQMVRKINNHAASRKIFFVLCPKSLLIFY